MIFVLLLVVLICIIKIKKVNDYIVQVLLAEALIKICMFVHKCSNKQMTESFLEVFNSSKNNIEWEIFQDNYSKKGSTFIYL